MAVVQIYFPSVDEDGKLMSFSVTFSLQSTEYTNKMDYLWLENGMLKLEIAQRKI